MLLPRARFLLYNQNALASLPKEQQGSPFAMKQKYSTCLQHCTHVNKAVGKQLMVKKAEHKNNCGNKAMTLAFKCASAMIAINFNFFCFVIGIIIKFNFFLYYLKFLK